MYQPLAYIHPDAKIAHNVVIEPFVTIHKDVEIDEGSWIGPHVTIMEGTRIGKHVRVFPGAVIGAIPQDMKFHGEASFVEIGNHTTIREYVTINRGTEHRRTTRIGHQVLLMAYVHIAHDCILGDHAILSNAVNLAGHVTIGEWGIIGGGSLVHQFVAIGPHSFISGGSLVRKDVPPFTKAAREPLGYAGINSVGLRRRGYSNETINHIQEIYRYVYLRGYNRTDSLAMIEAELPASEEKDSIIQFIQESTRGIMKGL